MDLNALPYLEDGSVPGMWRVTLHDPIYESFPSATFVNGVAEGVEGKALRRLVAAMGHQIRRIERTDAVEAPLLPAEPKSPAPSEANKPLDPLLAQPSEEPGISTVPETPAPKKAKRK